MTWRILVSFFIYLVWVVVDDPVLELPSADPAGPDEDEGLASERLHQRHLLVERELGLLEFGVVLRPKQLLPLLARGQRAAEADLGRVVGLGPHVGLPLLFQLPRRDQLGRLRRGLLGESSLPPVGIVLVDHGEDVAVLECEAGVGAWRQRVVIWVVVEESSDVAKDFLFRNDSFHANLSPEARRVRDAQLLEVLLGRLLDQEVQVFLRQGHEGAEVLGRVDGDVVDLEDDVAQLEAADLVDEAAAENARDDNAVIPVLNGEAELLPVHGLRDGDPVNLIIILPEKWNKHMTHVSPDKDLCRTYNILYKRSLKTDSVLNARKNAICNFLFSRKNIIGEKLVKLHKHLRSDILQSQKKLYLSCQLKLDSINI